MHYFAVKRLTAARTVSKEEKNKTKSYQTLASFEIAVLNNQLSWKTFFERFLWIETNS